jgi:hypothetical protein
MKNTISFRPTRSLGAEEVTQPSGVKSSPIEGDVGDFHQLASATI